MAISILDPMTHSGETEATTAIISAGTNRRLFVASLVVHTSDGKPRTSCVVGGQGLTQIAVADTDTRDVALSLWTATESQIQAMTDNTILLDGGVATGRSTIQWTVQGAEQSGERVAATLAGYSYSATQSLARLDGSMTFAVATGSNSNFNHLELTNPTQSSQVKAHSACIAWGSELGVVETVDTVASNNTQDDKAVVVLNIASASATANIDTDNNIDQFQRTVALTHSLASPLTSVLINNVEHIDLIQNSDAELKYIKRCYDAIGSDVTSVVLKNGVDADVTIPSVTVNTTHPYPVYRGLVDSKSFLKAVNEVSGDNAAFRITSQPTKGTLDLSDPAKYLHDVDASKGGVYTPNAGATGTDSFTFEVHDPDEPVALNRTQSGTVTINIAELGPDTTKPVITLIGEAVVYVGQNDTYTDAGANVTDNVDADSVLVASGSVDTSTLGSYTLTYNYTDAAGNAADTVTRTVHVIDAKPVITLNGSSTVFVDLNATYTDAGATWNDAKDGTGSVTAVGVVDTATLGTYTLTYDHTDTDTNAADTKYRSVVVRDPDEVAANKSILKSIWTPII